MMSSGLEASGGGAGRASAEGGTSCWVCGAPTRPFWAVPELTARRCAGCGHIVASHAAGASSGEADYHLSYEQEGFVAALRQTRVRQADRLLDVLAALPEPPRSLFDFGCGRGFLLERARERGLKEVAGGDVSELALGLLGELGVPALKLDAEQPFERLELGRLPFVPEAITLLDVIEHFPGDLGARLRPWVAGLPPGVRLVIIKVPVSDGLLFSLARVARRAGAPGLCRQLFQVGTYPPHQQYFSRRSLERLVRALGLEPLLSIDDLEFEPAELGRRMSGAPRALRQLAAPAGQLLGALAATARREDSRLVIARRPTRADAAAPAAASTSEGGIP